MSAWVRKRWVPALPWTVAAPALALVVLVLTWGRHLPAAIALVVSVFLAGAVLAAVHHAEVVAHRVGEPFGSLVLAVAVTVIEVALIVTLMISGGAKTAFTAASGPITAILAVGRAMVASGSKAGPAMA